jgi:hypothetical protein
MSKKVFDGWNAVVQINATDFVGYAERVSVRVNNNVSRFYELGNRNFAQIEAGNQEIDGSFDLKWVDSQLMELGTVSGGLTGGYTLYCYPSGDGATSAPYAFVNNVYVTDPSFEMNVDDLSTATVDFVAQSISVYGLGDPV